MRLLTWNVHGGKDARGVDTMDCISNTLAVSLADVICLQEVPSKSWADNMGARLFMFVFFHQTHPAGAGNLILSAANGSVVALRGLRRVWRCSSPRGAVAVKFPDVTVICTHFSADGSMVEQFRNAHDVDLLARRFHGNVLVAGDLNAHHFSPALARLRLRGWVDLWRTARERTHGYLGGCTFPARFPVQRIDYVLAKGPGVECVWAGVGADTPPESDHKCLVVDIK